MTSTVDLGPDNVSGNVNGSASSADSGDGANSSSGVRSQLPDLYGTPAPFSRGSEAGNTAATATAAQAGTRRIRRVRQPPSSDDDDQQQQRRSKTRPRELRRVRREIDAW